MSSGCLPIIVVGSLPQREVGPWVEPGVALVYLYMHIGSYTFRVNYVTFTTHPSGLVDESQDVLKSPACISPTASSSITASRVDRNISSPHRRSFRPHPNLCPPTICGLSDPGRLYKKSRVLLFMPLSRQHPQQAYR
ncbi:hypothetical protein PILCRDRAFT_828439 [Piloderma croceum F 1598]|uniref:Uncharacterized protein n=1 Tax=Piloderma croceum (strain F 1598) TaxID=765440 RepID=A0A0C3F258_PILCF|nr:hypothetical protein PILCRDRAFT_828439 [Piloderma croceum F 1598]